MFFSPHVSTHSSCKDSPNYCLHEPFVELLNSQLLATQSTVRSKLSVFLAGRCLSCFYVLAINHLHYAVCICTVCYCMCQGECWWTQVWAKENRFCSSCEFPVCIYWGSLQAFTARSDLPVFSCATLTHFCVWHILLRNGCRTKLLLIQINRGLFAKAKHFSNT